MTQKERLKLKAVLRDVKATTPEKLRKAGQLPAVLYGQGSQSQSITIDYRDFEKILKKAGESTIIDIEIGDGKTHPVLIHDIQKNYLTSKPQHVDFYEVSMSKKLKAKVILEFVGEAKAVKELGGVLVKTLNEAEVECLPQDLPHSIKVDISVLNSFTDAVHVKNLSVPENVKMLTNSEEIVAKVQPPREVEEVIEKPVEDISKVEGAAEAAPGTTDQQPKKEAVKAEAKEEKPKKE